MLALGAAVVVRGPKGERTIPVTQFFKGLFTTALSHDEILTEIQIPIPPPRSSGAYVKLERKVGDFATAGAAVQVTLAANGTVEQAGIGLTNAGPMPIKATDAEKYLVGKKPDAAVIAETARLAAKASVAHGRSPRFGRIQARDGSCAHDASLTIALVRAGGR